MSRPHPTTPDLIRTEIERMHARQTGDWQSLTRQVDDTYKQITYNLPQLFAIHIPPTVKELDLEWGRGTGKTTIYGKLTNVVARDLPRGTGQWIVPTYQKFLTEIIPAYIHALEMQGLYKDLHYFIGRPAPRNWNWPAAYKPPVRYDHFISFWTGFGMHLLSQDIPGAGRGLSTDLEFADEAVMLDPMKMEENSTPSLRGSNIDALGSRRWFDFRLKTSSTALTQAGEWFILREEMARANQARHRFQKANCVANKANLKPDYLKEARRTALDISTFEAEYLNIRPNFVRGGFYALLNEAQHTYTKFDYDRYGELVGITPDMDPDSVDYGKQYQRLIGVKPDCRGDGDLVKEQPLILGQDFGAAINSLTVSQYYPNSNLFRCLKDFYVLGADGDTQDDLAEAFHQYYQYHPVKTLYFWYDATGNHATGNTKMNKAQQTEAYLTAKGWKVIRMTVQGTNPRHFEKYRLWEQILQEADPRFPKFRINKVNAKATFISMSRAKSKKGNNNEVKKDKREERSDNKNRQLATDLSDAMDNPVFGMFAHLLSNLGVSLPS